MILFKDITTRDARFVGVIGFEFGNVDALLVAFYLFLENIHPHIVAAAEFRARCVYEDFHETRAGRPVAHFTVQFVSQHVAHQRLVRVGRIQHPIRLRRKAKD